MLLTLLTAIIVYFVLIDRTSFMKKKLKMFIVLYNFIAVTFCFFKSYKYLIVTGKIFDEVFINFKINDIHNLLKYYGLTSQKLKVWEIYAFCSFFQGILKKIRTWNYVVV